MGRDDVWVPNRGVDVNSRPRRAGYSRGNFSAMPGPHRRGHERSLGPGFPPAPLAFKGTVRPAFGLALYGGFLTRLSRPLGARVIFLRACRPSQTAHLPLSPAARPSQRHSRGRAVFHGRLHGPRKDHFDGSRLHYASATMPQRQAAVKLHGVFSSRWGLVDFAPPGGFTGPQAGTAGTSLIHSCAPELTRQGIWLP